MNLRVEIKRVSDGLVASEVWPDWADWTDGSIFWWTDGNAGCSCNRRVWFADAMGLPDDVEPKCGHGDFLVRLTDEATGKVLLDEFNHGHKRSAL